MPININNKLKGRVSAISIGKCPDFSDETVVLDIGSGFTKGGFVLESVPSVITPTMAGKPKNIYDVDINPYARIVGKQAKSRKNELNLSVRIVSRIYYY